MRDDDRAPSRSQARPARAFALLAALTLVAASPVRADDQQVGGNAIFKTYCASCHGKEARGDGPLSRNLRISPADLTRIAKRNKGEFDEDRIHRIIDGREPVKGHGDSDMPIWGDAFKRSGGGYDEKAIKARIDALVGHLKTIQAK